MIRTSMTFTPNDLLRDHRVTDLVHELGPARGQHAENGTEPRTLRRLELTIATDGRACSLRCRPPDRTSADRRCVTRERVDDQTLLVGHDDFLRVGVEIEQPLVELTTFCTNGI